MSDKHTGVCCVCSPAGVSRVVCRRVGRALSRAECRHAGHARGGGGLSPSETGGGTGSPWRSDTSSLRCGTGRAKSVDGFFPGRTPPAFDAVPGGRSPCRGSSVKGWEIGPSPSCRGLPKVVSEETARRRRRGAGRGKGHSVCVLPVRRGARTTCLVWECLTGGGPTGPVV